MDNKDISSLAGQKAAQRAAGRLARRGIDSGQRAAYDRLICEQAAGLPELAGARIVMSYMACGGEVCLARLHELLRARSVILAFPVCSDGGRLTAAAPDEDTAWERGAFGILSPILSGSRIFSPEEIDAVIVPMTAFDCRRYRVGQGGGYYDRFLPLCGRAVSIGAAYEAQRVESAAHDPAWDFALDYIVTEKSIY